MISYTAFLAVFLLSSTAVAFDGEFSYSSQDQWPAICVVGNTGRQSPIDIITDDVQADENLIELELEGWDVEYDGSFLNEGRTVSFSPNMPGLATIRNHLGTYNLQQCHFHWGTQDGVGSEHRIDSDAGELEIHFVHRKQDETNPTVGDYISVISVVAEVNEEEEIAGPWNQLNVSEILAVNNSIDVTGFRFDQLLPTNLEYYYYEGSMTSPPCYEVVGWFVMKNRITVPRDYLEELRRVEWSGGELLGFNFRMPQDVGDRVVTAVQSVATTMVGSQASVVKPAFPVSVMMLWVVLMKLI